MDRYELQLPLNRDFQTLLCLEQALFPDPWSEKSLATYFADSLAASSDKTVWPSILVYKDTKEQQVIGYCISVVVLDELQILRIGVAKTHQGQRLATDMLAAVLVRARTYGVKTSTLEYRESNFAAEKTYLHNAYYEVGRRKKYYGNEDAILMDCQVANCNPQEEIIQGEEQE